MIPRNIVLMGHARHPLGHLGRTFFWALKSMVLPLSLTQGTSTPT